MSNDKEKIAELAKLVKGFNDALDAACKYADEHGLEFNIEPSYGMGGTYIGEKHPERKEYENSGYSRMDNGWLASSTSC